VAHSKSHQGASGCRATNEPYGQSRPNTISEHERKDEGRVTSHKTPAAGCRPATAIADCRRMSANVRECRRMPPTTIANINLERPPPDHMNQTSPPSSATILVVEDRREVLEVLQRTLQDNGFAVLTAADGDTGLQLALDAQPDLIILDIGLPKRNGLAVARELRSRAFTGPVLMLTARDTVPDKVQGLEAGADDYLAKPFDYDELLARVRALLRRSALRDAQTLMKVADLTINPISREVVRGERTIALTQKEYALLEYLMRHAGRPVTREQISEHVWKQEFDPTTNIVDVYINYLRKKIDQDADRALVQTVRGVGYMLKGD
jgi:DNA-binding response OmpR family regulator